MVAMVVCSSAAMVMVVVKVVHGSNGSVQKCCYGDGGGEGSSW